VGSDVIKANPSMIGAFKIINRLDLENLIGFNYLKRYASELIQREEEKCELNFNQTNYHLGTKSYNHARAFRTQTFLNSVHLRGKSSALKILEKRTIVALRL